jgi:hypothetical protein
MAWKEVMVTMVKSLIGDLNQSCDCDDTRIIDAILTSGIITSALFEFDQDYTFDLVYKTITPDFTEPTYYDKNAIALIALRTACQLNIADYQQAARDGIKVKDGDSSVDTTGSFGGYKDILQMGSCAAFAKLLKQVSVTSGGGAKYGRVILGPFSHIDYGNRLGDLYNIRTIFDSYSTDFRR